MKTKGNIMFQIVLDITGIDFISLKVGSWINDTIIECFALHCIHAYENIQGNRILFLSSQGFAKLQCSIEEGYSSEKRVLDQLMKWSKCLNLFDIDIIIWPFNANRSHWCLTVAAVDTMQIHYMGPYNPYSQDMASRKDKDLITRCYNTVWNTYFSKFGITERWVFQKNGKSPHPFISLKFLKQPQWNGTDCGPIVCTYIWNVVTGSNLPSHITKKEDRNQHRSNQVFNDVRAWVGSTILSQCQS